MQVGIFILNFKPMVLQEALGLSLTPLAVLGIGKPAEEVFLIPASAADDLNYYRKDGAHFVPKLQVKDLVIENLLSRPAGFCRQSLPEGRDLGRG